MTDFCYGSSRDLPTASPARQVSVRNQTTLRRWGSNEIQCRLTYGSTLAQDNFCQRLIAGSKRYTSNALPDRLQCVAPRWGSCSGKNRSVDETDWLTAPGRVLTYLKRRLENLEPDPATLEAPTSLASFLRLNDKARTILERARGGHFQGR